MTLDQYLDTHTRSSETHHWTEQVLAFAGLVSSLDSKAEAQGLPKLGLKNIAKMVSLSHSQACRDYRLGKILRTAPGETIAMLSAETTKTDADKRLTFMLREHGPGLVGAARSSRNHQWAVGEHSQTRVYRVFEHKTKTYIAENTDLALFNVLYGNNDNFSIDCYETTIQRIS